MDPFSEKSLPELIRNATAPCVSIYMTPRGGREGAARFGQLLDEAEQRLLADGRSQDDIDDILYEARWLPQMESFWRGWSGGLAAFLCPGMEKHYRLPVEFEETVLVSELFYIKPLVPLVEEEAYHVLSLSDRVVRLFRCTKFWIEGRPLPGNMPRSLSEVVDESGKYVGFFTGRNEEEEGGPERRAAGAIQPEDVRRDQLLRFAQQIDAALHSHLGDDHAPLVVVSRRDLLTLYREVARCPRILEVAVQSPPEDLKPWDIHETSWKLVGPAFAQARSKAISRFSRHVRSDMASDDPQEVLRLATQGRAVLLLCSREGRLWGRFDERSGNLTLHQEKAPGDYEITNLAAVYTLASGGTVCIVEPGELPAGKFLGALPRNGGRPEAHRPARGESEA